MKIRLLIRRKDGSSVTLSGTTYRFNDENDHVAIVDDESHAEHLLNIEPRVFVEEVEDGDSAASGSNAQDKKQDEGSGDDAAKNPPATPEAVARRTRKPRAKKDSKE